nr:hypothetical protein [Tanacetum cinerariifolium]
YGRSGYSPRTPVGLVDAQRNNIQRSATMLYLSSRLPLIIASPALGSVALDLRRDCAFR